MYSAVRLALSDSILGRYSAYTGAVYIVPAPLHLNPVDFHVLSPRYSLRNIRHCTGRRRKTHLKCNQTSSDLTFTEPAALRHSFEIVLCVGTFEQQVPEGPLC